MPWLIIHYHNSFTLLLFRLPQISTVSSFKLALGCLCQPPLLFFKTFLHLLPQDVPGSSRISPVPALHSNISPEILTFLLENGVTNQDLGARYATGYHCFWAFIADQTRKCIYVYINIHIPMSASFPTCLYIH